MSNHPIIGVLLVVISMRQHEIKSPLPFTPPNKKGKENKYKCMVVLEGIILRIVLITSDIVTQI